MSIPGIRARRGVPAYQAMKRAMEGANMEWQPIETAPKDGTAIWLFDPDWDAKVPVAGWWERKYGGYWEMHEELLQCGDPIDPTHWMPLPKPPKGGPDE